MVYVNKMTFVNILYYLFLETWAFQIVYLKLYCKVAAYLSHAGKSSLRTSQIAKPTWQQSTFTINYIVKTPWS